jgi:hypothetical protein
MAFEGCRAVPFQRIEGCKNPLARRLITPAETMKQAFARQRSICHPRWHKTGNHFCLTLDLYLARNRPQNRIPLLLIARGC